MKLKFTTLIIAALCAVTFFQSCDKHDKGDYYYQRYGEIIGDKDNFKILLDDSTTLNIVENHTKEFEVKDGQRVIADFSILETATPAPTSSTEKELNVRLNYLYDVLCKAPNYLSKLSMEQIDSLGDNRAELLDGWISAKYFNFVFEFSRYDLDIKHMVSLIYDDKKSNSEELYFTFKHNAFEDKQAQLVRGRVSFDISDILATIQPDSSVKVNISWEGYLEPKVATFNYKKGK